MTAQASQPGGWSGFVYYRLHGSPTIYRSAYTAEFLSALAAEGEATGNALELGERLCVK